MKWIIIHGIPKISEKQEGSHECTYKTMIKSVLDGRWATLFALHTSTNHAERVSKYAEHKNKYNFDGMEFPVNIKDITKFEDQNANISVNVYHCNEKDKRIYSIRLTNETKKDHVNLLLLTLQLSRENSNEDCDILMILEISTLKDITAGSRI